MIATVCLLLFSGRPPPCWTLDDEQSAIVASRLAELPRKAGELRQGLGYSGVSVEVDRKLQATVRGGIAEVVRGPGLTEMLADTGRSLERWLLRTGEKHFPEMVAEILETELSSPNQPHG